MITACADGNLITFLYPNTVYVDRTLLGWARFLPVVVPRDSLIKMHSPVSQPVHSHYSVPNIRETAPDPVFLLLASVGQAK